MPSLLIHGGRIVDPSQDLDGPYDLLIEDGAVARIDGKIEKPEGIETVDATALLVSPAPTAPTLRGPGPAPAPASTARSRSPKESRRSTPPASSSPRG